MKKEKILKILKIIGKLLVIVGIPVIAIVFLGFSIKMIIGKFIGRAIAVIICVIVIIAVYIYLLRTLPKSFMKLK